MKNRYILKSSINNDHRIICQDNSEIILEHIDSVFAKILYNNGNKTHEAQGILSHVKGLNLLSKKSLFMNYSDDEAIKKYNQKANTNPQNQEQFFNQIALQEQKEQTQILSKHLHSTNNKLPSWTPNQINKDFFQEDSANHSHFTQDNLELKTHFTELQNLIAPDTTIKQVANNKDSIQIHTNHEIQKKENVKEQNALVVVNPYKLRNYSFGIPEYITIILNITPKSKILVYCPLDLNSPLEHSEINYLFPIVFNTETKFAAQIPLSIMDYPDFNKQKLKLYL
ncbi:hypothetical protein CQA53_05345 [Helicobacter didelphidarum]|uniref:Uncharacterized protein n=1 Tax=Helicobacter didelphidarum TaxID=2040648 RepID=A0A3D8IKK6_9HELI|nr:flagellar assembly protein FliW [Helicobacter didelphidarum]RDU65877.1 hypothetical protein CQA53_05345 [Helicobacter didelphidarum]